MERGRAERGEREREGGERDGMTGTTWWSLVTMCRLAWAMFPYFEKAEFLLHRYNKDRKGTERERREREMG
jgi:hypothetical protein